MSIHRPIDFQKNNSDLQSIMFPVEKVPIFMELPPLASSLFHKTQYDKIDIPDYLAIVNKSSNEILSVVSKNYKLISNKEALEIGKNAFMKLFQIDANLNVFKIISSKRKTFCHIDLIHENVNLNTWEQDTWYPFLRITNSYNKMFALSFELGFVRKLCSNGVIFNKKTVSVKYSHNVEIKDLKINVDIQKLKSIKNEFVTHMYNLKRFYVEQKYFFPIVCKALGQKKPGSLKDNKENERKVKMYEHLHSTTMSLGKDYINYDGPNAYALFNVITDIVSHQNEYQNLDNYELNPGSYYHKPAIWLEEFVINAERRDFSIDKYIEGYS